MIKMAIGMLSKRLINWFTLCNLIEDKEQIQVIKFQ